MKIRNNSTKIVILIILAVLPALFPFGGRDGYILDFIPSFIDTTDGTFLPWVLLFGCLFLTCVWCVYGYLFARWFGRSKIWFVICNAPVIINAISEIVYYNILGFGSEDYPAVAYLIGSHIDKINPLEHIFGMGSIILTIGISVIYCIILFWAGYKVGAARE